MQLSLSGFRSTQTTKLANQSKLNKSGKVAKKQTSLQLDLDICIEFI